MSAIDFLIQKGILEEGYEKWIITYPDGKEVDIVELMQEYGDEQREAGSEAMFYGSQK